jgi:hypothetical protein
MKIAVICTLLFMLVKPFWPVVDYMLNYDYIVENLCENRDKPQLKCNGKCYLSKQLSKEAKDAETNPFDKSKTYDFSQQIVFLESLASYHFSTSDFKIKEAINSKDQKGDSSLFAYVLPKPPDAWFLHFT